MTALADFDDLTAEQALLHSANFDPNIAIRRRAIHGFRAAPRALTEDSVPSPSAVPVSPATAVLEKHRADYRRYVAETQNETHFEDFGSAPDRPPSAVQLWERDEIKGGSSILLPVFCFMLSSILLHEAILLIASLPPCPRRRGL